MKCSESECWPREVVVQAGGGMVGIPATNVDLSLLESELVKVRLTNRLFLVCHQSVTERSLPSIQHSLHRFVYSKYVESRKQYLGFKQSRCNRSVSIVVETCGAMHDTSTAQRHKTIYDVQRSCQLLQSIKKLRLFLLFHNHSRQLSLRPRIRLCQTRL